MRRQVRGELPAVTVDANGTIDTSNRAMSVRRTMPDGPPSRIPRLKSGRRKGARAARGDLSYECAGKVGDRRRCRSPPGGAKRSGLPLRNAGREIEGRELD